MTALHGYTPAEDGLTNEQFHDQIRRHMTEARQLRAQAMADGARRLGGTVARMLSPLIRPLERSLSRRRRQRMVHDELTAYSDPELADTGIHRADIPEVARKAA
ncbi:MAG TPA: hypothetical protein VFZ01_07325 [Geminicoccaceae bacterium]